MGKDRTLLKGDGASRALFGAGSVTTGPTKAAEDQLLLECLGRTGLAKKTGACLNVDRADEDGAPAPPGAGLDDSLTIEGSKAPVSLELAATETGLAKVEPKSLQGLVLTGTGWSEAQGCQLLLDLVSATARLPARGAPVPP